MNTRVSKLLVPAISILVAGVIEQIRRTYYYRMKSYYYERKIRSTAKSVGSTLYVRGDCLVNNQTELGDRIFLHGLFVRGRGKLRIGNNFHAGEGCVILTENHNYDQGDALPYDDSRVKKEVVIEDNVWLGIDVTVLPGVTIGEGAIIQAGSTVTEDIPKGAIAGGHPAVVFDQRDMDHYERLKAEQQFN